MTSAIATNFFWRYARSKSMMMIYDIIPTLMGIAIVILASYYVYYLVTNDLLTARPFLNPEELLIFRFDMNYYVDRPSEFIKSVLTVGNFWFMIGIVIVYFVFVSKFFNPFPTITDNGYYVFMLDANRLHILRLKETYSKIFVWREKAYFLPNQTLKYNNATILLYLSNISVPINALRISKDDMEMMVKVLLNYVYSHKSYSNRIGKVIKIFPRDVLKRNYMIVIDKNDGSMKIVNTYGMERGTYNVTRYVTCSIYFVTKDRQIEKLDESNIMPSVVIGEIEIPVMAEVSTAAGKRTLMESILSTQFGSKRLTKMYSYVDFGMNITNPYLAYDILTYRKVMISLHRYFVGALSGKVLPLVLIMMIIILLVLFFPQLQTMLTGSS